MTIEFQCPSCGRALRTTDDKAGLSANCPGCGNRVTVPSSGDEGGDSPWGSPPAGFQPPPLPSDRASRGGLEEREPEEYAIPVPPPLPQEEERPAGGSRGRTVLCPMCGERASASATRCPSCGEALGDEEDFDAERPRQRKRRSLEPHRGGVILALGIVSWVTGCCFPLGLAAWLMGSEDLKKMRNGEMDPDGEGLTQAGRIVGVIHVVLVALGAILWCAVMMLIFATRL